MWHYAVFVLQDGTASLPVTGAVSSIIAHMCAGVSGLPSWLTCTGLCNLACASQATEAPFAETAPLHSASCSQIWAPQGGRIPLQHKPHQPCHDPQVPGVSRQGTSAWQDAGGTLIWLVRREV